jgi:hypothetical protein
MRLGRSDYFKVARNQVRIAGPARERDLPTADIPQYPRQIEAQKVVALALVEARERLSKREDHVLIAERNPPPHQNLWVNAGWGRSPSA